MVDVDGVAGLPVVEVGGDLWDRAEDADVAARVEAAGRNERELAAPVREAGAVAGGVGGTDRDPAGGGSVGRLQDGGGEVDRALALVAAGTHDEHTGGERVVDRVDDVLRHRRLDQAEVDDANVRVGQPLDARRDLQVVERDRLVDRQPACAAVAREAEAVVVRGGDHRRDERPVADEVVGGSVRALVPERLRDLAPQVPNIRDSAVDDADEDARIALGQAERGVGADGVERPLVRRSRARIDLPRERVVANVRRSDATQRLDVAETPVTPRRERRELPWGAREDCEPQLRQALQHAESEDVRIDAGGEADHRASAREARRGRGCRRGTAPAHRRIGRRRRRDAGQRH